jgi:hypothetical protein
MRGRVLAGLNSSRAVGICGPMRNRFHVGNLSGPFVCCGHWTRASRFSVIGICSCAR